LLLILLILIIFPLIQSAQFQTTQSKYSLSVTFFADNFKQYVTNRCKVWLNKNIVILIVPIYYQPMIQSLNQNLNVGTIKFVEENTLISKILMKTHVMNAKMRTLCIFTIIIVRNNDKI